MADRKRVKPVGYDAGQKIDAAIEEYDAIISETRKLINQPNSTDERFLRLGKILDAAHEGKAKLKEIKKE